MKSKANEWISIADLMAGVMAVVMLLLVVSILQRTLEAGDELKQQQKVRQLLAALDEEVRNGGAEKLVTIDRQRGMILLTSSFFDDGSACVKKDDVKKAIQLIQPSVTEFLAKAPDGDVLVEGYTNGIPVRDIRVRKENAKQFDEKYCSLYDDNLTLSAARAREVRKQMLADASLNRSDAGRIIVAGYGDSHPIVENDPNDDRNKRVEIRLRIKRKSER